MKLIQLPFFQLKKWGKELGLKNFYVLMRDEIKQLKERKQFSCIYNIHESNEKGIHWDCIFKINNFCYCFSSYGLPPIKEILNICEHGIYSTFKLQELGEKICGQMCLYFLFELNKNSSEGNYKSIILKLHELKYQS